MNFNMTNIMTYLGNTVVVIFVIYIITKMLSLNNKIIGTMLAPEREGLTMADAVHHEDDELLKKLEKLRHEYATFLLKDASIEDYKDMILVTEDIYHIAMIGKITEAVTAKGNNSIVGTKTLDYLSKIQSAKAGLKDLDEFLTHYKA